MEANVVIDATPLSKLFSKYLLEFANKYQVPCFYLEWKGEGESFILWLYHWYLKYAFQDHVTISF